MLIRQEAFARKIPSKAQEIAIQKKRVPKTQHRINGYLADSQNVNAITKSSKRNYYAQYKNGVKISVATLHCNSQSKHKLKTNQNAKIAARNQATIFVQNNPHKTKTLTFAEP